MFEFLQIAPVYLSSCEKQGLSLLELLFYRQPVQDNKLLIKVSFVYLLLLKVLGSCQKPSPGNYVSPDAEFGDLPSI